MTTESATPQSGHVKWFNSTKGFGFITPDDGGEELFVHQTSIKAEGFRSLGEGESVEYTIETSSEGRTKAVNVTGPGGANVLGAPRRGDSFGGGRGGPGFPGRGAGRGFGGRGRGFAAGGAGFGGATCYNCNQPGHIARDCAQAPSGGGGGGNRSCYTCGLPGHIARECPNPAQN